MLSIFSMCLMCTPTCVAVAQESSPAATAALEYLKSLPRKWAGEGQPIRSDYDCHTYEDKNIDRLIPTFATRAATFLQAFHAMYENAVATLTITSAHRTHEEQACVCEGERGPCAGRVWARVWIDRHMQWMGRMLPGKHSSHESGLALDVRAGVGLKVEYQCMQDFAQQNPQYGIYFRLGMKDRPHMQSNGMSEDKLRPGSPAKRVPSCEKLDVKNFGGVY